MTPEQRTLRARIAAHSMHGQGKTNTEAARKAAADRFEKQADPNGELSERERARRAEHLRRAHYARLSLAGVRARQAKAGSRSS